MDPLPLPQWYRHGVDSGLSPYVRRYHEYLEPLGLDPTILPTTEKEVTNAIVCGLPLPGTNLTILLRDPYTLHRELGEVLELTNYYAPKEAAPKTREDHYWHGKRMANASEGRFPHIVRPLAKPPEAGDLVYRGPNSDEFEVRDYEPKHAAFGRSYHVKRVPFEQVLPSSRKRKSAP